MKVLVTGAAGFIGFHAAGALLARGDEVVGLDNLNGYYDVALKQARLARLQSVAGFRFERMALEDRDAIAALFARERFEAVLHLAAQAGVRYSLENPHAYIDANITGFLNILEGCRRNPVAHLVFASSSSVYGASARSPFCVSHNVDHPLSLYAATKKSNELMAHTYAQLYAIPATGLRYFTVYGPWGRPDMSPMLFARRIIAGEAIDVFNHGNHARDFTYIDDIVTGTLRVLDTPARPDPDWNPANPDPASSCAPYRLYNIGNGAPVPLMEFIACLEQALGRKAEKNFLPMQPGDVEATCADVSALERDFGFRPATPVREGVTRFVRWYKDYYGHN